MKPTTLAWAMVLGAVLALPGMARAQETVLSGTVTDATEAVLPGVTLTALHVESGNTFVGVSDTAGEYRIGALRPGVYTITAELPGFGTVRRENLELLLGQRAVVNFDLPVSGVQELVTVTGQSPLVDITQSTLSGNIDSRQMQELPLNGRNWVQLTMLAPGSRANAVTDSPIPRAAGAVQFNLDGQQLTQTIIAVGETGQAKFSRDAIGEFEFVTNRFDATQGRSMGVLVNAITKAGTNRFSGSGSGFFRHDNFNAKDFVVGRVLPYSNQQLVGTFGGPIKKDKVHFFGYEEYEREPQTYVFTSPYPRFNLDLSGTTAQQNGGARVDFQFTDRTRLMVRGNYYALENPYDFRRTGGSTRHPSGSSWGKRESNQQFAVFTQVLGPTLIHEIRGGHTLFVFKHDGVVPFSPQIELPSYTIGKATDHPQDISQRNYQIRDDLTLVRTGAGRHEVKLGGEYLYQRVRFYHTRFRDGSIVATRGQIPADILQDLFPVWNDSSTWNLAALSPYTIRYIQSFGTYVFYNPRNVAAAWVQDSWTLTPHLTLNLGLRWDLSRGALAEDLTLPPFVPEKRPTEKAKFGPRLGFAYSLPDNKTVFRGGWGKYYGEIEDNVRWGMMQSILTAIPELPNDGRPNFAADPWNVSGGGHVPTFEEASRLRRSMNSNLASPDLKSPYSHQASLGVQRQIGQTMAVEADYTFTGTRREFSARNKNLRYDAVTGANYPFSNISLRPYPEWGNIGMNFNQVWSNYHALQTAFTRRFSNGWQASATYTLGTLKDGRLCPVPGLACPDDLGGAYTYSAGDQRHRAVFNGIWQLPVGFQVSGLYFFGSGARFATSWGGDLRDTGAVSAAGGFTTGRLRPNGTIVPRANFVGLPLHRVDLRVQRRTSIRGVSLDGIFEVFNLFNHANYGAYTTAESNRNYGKPAQNTNVAYAPRTLQLGFRVTF